MAEKLSIQIALEGGKEIERQLEGIGDAGQKAFEDIAKSAEQVGGFKNLKPEEVTQKLKDVGLAGTEAFDKITKAVANASRMERVVVGLQNIEDAFGKVTQAAGALATRFGPIAAAISTALGSVVVSTFKTADAISAVNAQAQKLGLTIEQFDQLRLGFEKAGIAAKAIGDGIAHFKGELDKLNVDRIKTAFTELEDAAKRGFGAQGTAQLKLLEEAAKGTGEAARTARGYLEKLGLPIPGEAQATLERLGITTTDTAAAMRQAMVALQEMPDGAQRTADAFAILGNTMGPQFIAALQTGSFKIEEFSNKTNALTQQQAVEAAKLQQAWNRLSSAWERFSGLTFNDTIIAGLNLATAAVEKLTAAVKWMAEAWETVKKPLQWLADKMNELIKASQNALDKLVKLLGLGEQVGGGSGGNPVTAPQGFAGGGHVGGRGSGTSDSNLAWVSRGEHIMPAHAVRQPGVLAFLEALRRSGGNLSRVLDGMGRFALGGMVPRPMAAMPALAGGNPAHRDLGTVRLVLPDGVMVSGLADAQIVEALGRAAAKAQVRSGGRKPSRYS